MNTIDYPGFKNLGGIVDVKFPSPDDMPIDGKAAIEELQKMIDEGFSGYSFTELDAGLKLAITILKKMQKSSYEDLLAKCKLTQI